MRARLLASALLLGGLVLGSALDADAQQRGRGRGDEGRSPRYSQPGRSDHGGGYGRHVQPYRSYGHGYRYAPAPRYYRSRPYRSPYYAPYGGYYYDPYYYSYPYGYAPHYAPYYGRPGIGIWFRF
jgi:hypothetical protein